MLSLLASPDTQKCSRGKGFKKKMGENRAGVHTCIPGEGAQCRIVEKERDSENREYRSVG
jgi:hypothetical protein